MERALAEARRLKVGAPDDRTFETSDETVPARNEPVRNEPAGGTSDDLYGTTALTPTTASGSPKVSDLSLAGMVRKLVSRWHVVLLCALLGAGAAAAYSLTLPSRYQSVAAVVLEPRGLDILPDAVSPNRINSEATIAYSQSQVDIIRSSRVMEAVIRREDLTADPEFIDPPTALERLGLPSLRSMLTPLLGPEEKPDPALARGELVRELSKRLYAERRNQTFVIEIGFTSQSPTKAARIANSFADAYLAEIRNAQNDVAATANAGLAGRIDDLRRRVRDAEALIEAHKKKFGLVETNGKLVDEEQLARLNDQLANATALTAEARSRVALAREVDVNDVVGGGLPAVLQSPGLAQLRTAYARAKSNDDRLAVNLGERHPRRRQAAAEVASAETAIRGEIARLVEAAERAFSLARARERDLRASVDELREATLDNNAAKARLRELERRLEAERRTYESVLRRSRETEEQTQVALANARVIDEAMPPRDKAGPPRRVITMAGGLIGGGLGGLLVLLPMFWRAGRAFLRDEPREDARAFEPTPIASMPRHVVQAAPAAPQTFVPLATGMRTATSVVVQNVDAAPEEPVAVTEDEIAAAIAETPVSEPPMARTPVDDLAGKPKRRKRVRRRRRKPPVATKAVESVETEPTTVVEPTAVEPSTAETVEPAVPAAPTPADPDAVALAVEKATKEMMARIRDEQERADREAAQRQMELADDARRLAEREKALVASAEEAVREARAAREEGQRQSEEAREEARRAVALAERRAREAEAAARDAEEAREALEAEWDREAYHEDEHREDAWSPGLPNHLPETPEAAREAMRRMAAQQAALAAYWGTQAPMAPSQSDLLVRPAAGAQQPAPSEAKQPATADAMPPVWPYPLPPQGWGQG